MHFLMLKMDQTQKLSSIAVVSAAILDNKHIWLILQPYKFLRAHLSVIRVCTRFLCTVDFLNMFKEPQKNLMQEINVDCLCTPSHYQCNILKVLGRFKAFVIFLERQFQGPVDLS